MPIREDQVMASLVDFVLQACEGREFRILQLTDIQIIDPGQSRYPERINNITPISDEQLYADCFHYIKSTIEKAKPDLILMTARQGTVLCLNGNNYEDRGRFSVLTATIMAA